LASNERSDFLCKAISEITELTEIIKKRRKQRADIFRSAAARNHNSKVKGESKMFTIWGYSIYLVLSIAATIWVATTLYRNGRVFLIESFHGHAEMADSVNCLLVVGFYLINVGFVSLALKYGDKPDNVQQVFEAVSTKFGMVLLILGAMHFFNLYLFSRIRNAGQLDRLLTSPQDAYGDTLAAAKQAAKS
jgi:hypothetical protein